MRPQNIALVVASVVTGLFLASVGLVAVWPLFSELEPRAFQLGGNVQRDVVFEQDFQIPREQPIPQQEMPKARGTVVLAKDYALSEPHTHGNLTIFLIHGKDLSKNSKILTLQEALDQNVATVRDTGARLTIDNRANAALFIQAGDIVKGGTQDRTLPYDMLVPARTNDVPIAALCVEQGRSSPRGNELSASFQTSSEQLPSRQLKLAAYRQSQGDVWNNIRIMQDNLARNTGGSVQAQQSNTSLQLSLEHHRVQDAIQDYLANLSPAAEGKNDVIGYAVVVNGKIHSADVYASNALFQKLWPKLIRASAIEALAERHQAGAIDPPAAAAVEAFLTNAEKGQAFRVDSNRTTVIRHESGQALLFDTCDGRADNLVLHRSFLSK